MLKGYFDGGGANNVASPVVALAGYFAEDTAWPELEGAWAEVIGGGPPMHAAQAYGANGDYKGWEFSESRARLGKCVDVLAALDRERFTAVWCLVPVADYARAQADRPRLKDKTIHAFCVDHTVGLMLNRVGVDPDDPEKFLKQAIFDQNEDFLHQMHRVWRGPHGMRPWWVELFDEIRTAQAKTTLPLQAADVLAWAVYRQFATGEVSDWHASLTAGWDTGTHHVYDDESIKAEILP